MAGKGCGYTVAELTESRVFGNEEQGTTQLQHRDRCTRFECAGITVFFGNGDLSFFSKPGSSQVRHWQGGIIGGGHLPSPWLCGRIFLPHEANFTTQCCQPQEESLLFRLALPVGPGPPGGLPCQSPR